MRKVNAKQVAEARREIMDNLRRIERLTHEEQENVVILAAYVLYKISSGEMTYNWNEPFTSFANAIGNKNNVPGPSAHLMSELERVFRNERVEDNRHIVDTDKVIWIAQLKDAFSPEVYAAIVLEADAYSTSRSADVFTPRSVIDLALQLLQIQNGDKVADFCCGSANFIAAASEITSDAIFTGYDVNYKKLAIAEAKADILKNNFNVQLTSVFSLYGDEKNAKFDKIFSHYPFGMVVNEYSDSHDVYRDLEAAAQLPKAKRHITAEWLFNTLVMERLNEKGKAVVVMPEGVLWNGQNQPVRKYFIEQGFIEAVISLPERMLNRAMVGISVVVLSRGNKTIKMVDATNLGAQNRSTRGGRLISLSDDDIAKILDALKEDTDISKTMGYEKINDLNFSLDTKQYVAGEYTLDGGLPFETVIKEITRGASIAASDLDEITSEKVTPFQYLSIGDIQNNMMSDNLPYLTGIDKKWEKYCLKQNDLIISKIGASPKVAVVDVDEARKILATGNLYIVRLEEEKVNPYFLKAFFSSKKGQEALRSITVGRTIPSISLGKLKQLLIPLPDLEEQNNVAALYGAKEDEIKVLEMKLQKAVEELEMIYSENADE